ncbi:MAG: O-antigen ligase family protein, partial [Candidatus Bipolaricaulota bacterium]
MEFSSDEILKKTREVFPGFRKVRFYFLLFFTLTMPLVIYLGNTEYGYTKTIYTYIYVSFLFLLWAVELILKEKLTLALTELSVPVALLLVSGLLSLKNAPSKGAVLQSLGLLVYFYLIYLLVANTVQTKREGEYLLIALITSGVGATIYGVLQFYGVVRGVHGYSGGAGNIISVMGNRNYLGGFVAYLFVPAFALVISSRSKLIKLYLSLALGSFFFLLFPIGSRGSWLALTLGGLFFVFSLLYYRPLSGFRRKDALVALTVTLVILVAVYLIAPTPNPLSFNLGLPSSDQLREPWRILTGFVDRLEQELVEEGGARIEDWKIGLKMLKDHPFVGIGLGNYKIKFLEYRAKLLSSPQGEGFGGYISRGAQAHNEYVQFTAELGAVGVTAIIIGLLILMANVLRRVLRTQEDPNRLLGFALIAGLLGFLLHSAVSFPAHLPASSFAFVTFLGLINSRIFGERQLKVSLRGLTRYVVFAVLAALVLAVSVFAYRDWRANVLRGQGQTQMDRGNFYLAKESFRRSLSLDFQPRQTYYYLGLTERQLGNNEEALKYFERSRGQFEPYQLFLHLGSLYLNQGKLDKAEEDFKAILSMDPKREHQIEATYYLSLITIRRGNIGEAEEHLK